MILWVLIVIGAYLFVMLAGDAAIWLLDSFFVRFQNWCNSQIEAMDNYQNDRE